jgi:hypothetical protein
VYFGNNHFRHNIFFIRRGTEKDKDRDKNTTEKKKRAQTEALCHFIIRTKRTLRKNEIKLQTKIQRIEEERD